MEMHPYARSFIQASDMTAPSPTHWIAGGIANLHYLVVEPGIVKSHEVPVGWGLLERDGGKLSVRQMPGWHPIGAEEQLVFLQRVAAAGPPRVRLSEEAPE